MNANLFARLAERFPEAAAPFAELTDGRRYAYGDLEQVSGRFAAALQGMGVQPGDRVAVQVEKSIEALMLYLATVRAGAVFLPLNTAYTPAEVEYFLTDAEPALFVCAPEKAEALRPKAREGRRPAGDDGRLARRHGPGRPRHLLRPGAGAGGVPDRRAGAGRSGDDPLHLGHDGALEGRDDDAREPGLERLDAGRVLAFHAATTCCCTRCRSSTRTGCSRRATRCWRPAPR